MIELLTLWNNKRGKQEYAQQKFSHKLKIVHDRKCGDVKHDLRNKKIWKCERSVPHVRILMNNLKPVKLNERSLCPELKFQFRKTGNEVH